jgi:hypothetical protein
MLAVESLMVVMMQLLVMREGDDGDEGGLSEWWESSEPPIWTRGVGSKPSFRLLSLALFL